MANRYHRVLGVSDDASPAQLKAAFRRLAHRYHPDISAEENATEKFTEVVEAYRALTAEKNANTGGIFKKANKQKSNHANEDKSSRPSKGKDCRIDAYLSVEELYWGVELKVNPSSLCLGRRSKKDGRHPSLLRVKIPRGTRHGARLRLRGEGLPIRRSYANGPILRLRMQCAGGRSGIDAAIPSACGSDFGKCDNAHYWQLLPLWLIYFE